MSNEIDNNLKTPIIANEEVVRNQMEEITCDSMTSEHSVAIQNKRIENLRKALRTKPQTIRCPFCEKNGETEVVRSCNTKNTLCSIVTLSFGWIIYMICKGKDLNCCNAIHTCKYCHRILGDYSAC